MQNFLPIAKLYQKRLVFEMAHNITSGAHFNPTVILTALNGSLQNFQNDSLVNVSRVASVSVSTRPIRGATKILCYCLYGIIFSFGAFGNSVVFYVIGIKKTKHSSSDIFILSLACADFLSSVFVPLVMLNDLATDFSGWLYGSAMCVVFPSILPATLCASSWSMVLISIDRHRIIAKPFASRLNRWEIAAALCCIWCFSIGVTIPYSLRLQVTGSVCWDSNDDIIRAGDYIIYIAFWVFCIWCLPNIIITIEYIFASGALKKNTAQHANNQAMLIRNKQNKKIVRMFIIIVVLFFFLTMPYAILYFILNYIILYSPASLDPELIFTLNYTIFIPAAFSGCVNPIVYAKLQREVNGFLKETKLRICVLLRSIFIHRVRNSYSVKTIWSTSSHSRTDESSI